MNVEVKLFAVAKQLAGSETVSVELPPNAKVKDLRTALGKREDLRDIIDRAMIAIDAEYASDDAIVSEKAEIALIPPVSGG